MLVDADGDGGEVAAPIARDDPRAGSGLGNGSLGKPERRADHDQHAADGGQQAADGLEPERERDADERPARSRPRAAATS